MVPLICRADLVFLGSLFSLPHGLPPPQLILIVVFFLFFITTQSIYTVSPRCIGNAPTRGMAKDILTLANTKPRTLYMSMHTQ